MNSSYQLMAAEIEQQKERLQLLATENARLREALERAIRRFQSLYELKVHVAESGAYAGEARAALEQK